MAQATRIAIVDDEQDMRRSVSQWLALSGFETETFACAEDALGALGPDYPGAVITDIKMPGMGGMQFLRRLMNVDSALPVIMITGHGDVPMAVEAMRVGAFDFLEKPFDPERMTELAEKATRCRRLALDNRALRRELSGGATLMERFVGESPAMNRLREEILDFGQADGHVLIVGEAGTGKTLAAHALHAVGSGSGRGFVVMSCAAAGGAGAGGAGLAGRLFGSEEAAGDARPPALEEARGGTLVLEDIEALPEEVQARLLAWMGEQGERPETRLVAVSNTGGKGASCEDALRPDLYYRLAAMTLALPPLRRRGRDVLALFARFCEQFAEEYGCAPPRLPSRDADRLLKAPWPGNLRQLESVAERAVLQSRRGSGGIAALLEPEREDVPEVAEAAPAGEPGDKPLKEHMEAYEKALIENAMRRRRGSIADVMAELGLPRRTLNEKMAKYGLRRADFM